LTTSGKFATGGINNSGNTRKINDVNNNRIPTTASYKVKQSNCREPGVVATGGKLPSHQNICHRCTGINYVH
jgi:hypothetical protein